MKIGLYADPHISQTSSIIVGRQGEFTGRLDNLIKSFTWMNNFFKEQGVSEIICLGDMTDKPNLTSEEITALSKCGVEDHHFIVGNHCRSDKDGQINSLNIFNKVYSSPRYIECEDGVVIYVLPYNSTPVDLNSLEVKPDIILSHNDLKGYDFGGHVSESGYSLDDILANCKLFVNGHLHNGGWIVDGRIMNLGNLSGVNFSSCGGQWEPSVGIIDTETMQITLYENPEAYRFKKIEVGTLPKLKGYLDNLESGHYVLQVKVPESLAARARKLLDQCDKVDASRVLTVTTKKSSQKAPQSIKFDQTSIYDKLRGFVNQQKPEKYSMSKIANIIDEIEKQEGAD